MIKINTFRYHYFDIGFVPNVRAFKVFVSQRIYRPVVSIDKLYETDLSRCKKAVAKKKNRTGMRNTKIISI